MRLLVLLCLIPGVLAAQSPTLAADSAIAAGQPWRATQLLAPLLATPATRTPDVVILAARAAAAWEGWTTVRKLLEHENWLDDRFDRLGRRLLAEGQIADNQNPEALANAQAAVRAGDARDPTEQARRELLLARAHDRLDELDSAAIWYRNARDLLPGISDWVALRAAGVTSDSTSRSALLGTVTLPAATPRVPWTEALARDRSDDFAGAAARYDQLGARVPALQVRWRGAVTDSAKAAIAAALAAFLRAPATSILDARDALDLMEKIAPPFTRDDRLSVARRAATVTRPQDAVDQFAEAAKEAPLAARDQVTYGAALGALQRWPEAAAQFASITDPAVAGLAAYYHARALLRASDESGAIVALRQVVRRFPADTAAASIALALLADLAIDAGQVDSARAYYLHLSARYPTSTQRSHAILLAAIIAYGRGKPALTMHELNVALENHLLTGEIDASRYWLARATAATGDSATARSIWRELVTKGPDSYYAVRAAARLDTIPWTGFTPATIRFPDSLAATFARAQLLEQLGLAAEAKFERDKVAADARGAAALTIAGEAFLSQGFPSRGSQLAQRAVATGVSRDATLWELMYPMPLASTLRDVAAAEHVDPLLVASVIRQESGFDPHATSRTNARGLMQVEPTVGKQLAQNLGFPDFDPALLWIPQVNLVLGIHHFAVALARYPETERGVASYNAGTSRVDHWSVSPLSGVTRGADQVRDPLDDVDFFVERIPFVETRDYVRAIVRNREVYRMIYGATAGN